MPIFISYSHEDDKFALQLASQLVQHKTRIWIDKWELHVGDSLIDRIQNAIQDASALIVILSKASVASEWCKKELNVALIRELDEKRVVVLPVLIEDCEIPLFLRDKFYADFTKSYDDGIREVLEATASVTSENLGRHTDSQYYIDWSVDYGLVDDDGFFEEITMLEQAKDHPYSVLTVVTVIGNDAASERFKLLTAADLAWFQISDLNCELANLANENDLRLLLEDEKPQNVNFGSIDPKTGLEFTVHVTSRRIGKDTGRPILIDVGGQLQMVCNAQKEKLRELTAEERKQISLIDKQTGSQ